MLIDSRESNPMNYYYVINSDGKWYIFDCFFQIHFRVTMANYGTINTESINMLLPYFTHDHIRKCNEAHIRLKDPV